MEMSTILIIGFVAVLVLLWEIFKELIGINLHSEQTSKHLFEIEHEIKNKTETDLCGPNLADLSSIEDHLEKINNKLESIESLVDVIKDEINDKEE